MVACPAHDKRDYYVFLRDKSHSLFQRAPSSVQGCDGARTACPSHPQTSRASLLPCPPGHLSPGRWGHRRQSKGRGEAGPSAPGRGSNRGRRRWVRRSGVGGRPPARCPSSPPASLPVPAHGWGRGKAVPPRVSRCRLLPPSLLPPSVLLCSLSRACAAGQRGWRVQAPGRHHLV